MKTAVEWLVEELKGVYESDYLNKLIEQAKELVDLFTVIGLQQRNEGIQCAILSVDKILEVLLSKSVSNEFWIMYYEQVKKEIELL